MTPFPSIIVLTDFFAVSNRALSYAGELAEPLGAQLVLLHVQHDALLDPAEHGPHRTRREEHKAAHQLVQLAEQQPVPAVAEISDAFLPDAIRESVEHHHPLMLVLGRPGTANTPSDLVTGATMDLMRTVHRPLLVVPTVGWGTVPPRRLAIAIDDSAFTLMQHDDLVRRLQTCLGASLSLVHVAPPHEPEPTPESLLKLTSAAGISSEIPATSVHTVYHTEPAAGILQAAHEVKADLLVLVARRRSLFGSLFHRSVTAQVVAESPVPVLLLPAAE
ncbi:universal stress protein [Hymenobacter latericus]|uniref:universal stress protein n=1 Tax=Hymenobacter sp. YIM 151858-1 TaxID=2987688 RepID=UPI002227E3FB|nr:universal stress protein [Hymenobacter sp. YIM 151858-1]UYZ59706.1 universal stress protein [Hymenobacter sp. YIM 151858-1]